jgi:hypothetical protein
VAELPPHEDVREFARQAVTGHLLVPCARPYLRFAYLRNRFVGLHSHVPGVSALLGKLRVVGDFGLVRGVEYGSGALL